MKNILLSFVIPTRHARSKSLARLLDSIDKNPPLDGWEIILVENNSAKPILHNSQRNLHYIHTTTIGANHARNLGIKKTRGQYICFLDDDCEIPASFIPYLKKLINNFPNVDAWGGEYISPECFPNSFSLAYFILYKIWWKNILKWQIPFLVGGACIIKKSALQNISFESSRQFGGTEISLISQLLDNGCSIKISSHLQIIHHVHISFSSFLQKAYLQGKGNQNPEAQYFQVKTPKRHWKNQLTQDSLYLKEPLSIRLTLKPLLYLYQFVFDYGFYGSFFKIFVRRCEPFFQMYLTFIMRLLQLFQTLLHNLKVIPAKGYHSTIVVLMRLSQLFQTLTYNLKVTSSNFAHKEKHTLSSFYRELHVYILNLKQKKHFIIPEKSWNKRLLSGWETGEFYNLEEINNDHFFYWPSDAEEVLPILKIKNLYLIIDKDIFSKLYTDSNLTNAVKQKNKILMIDRDIFNLLHQSDYLQWAIKQNFYFFFLYNSSFYQGVYCSSEDVFNLIYQHHKMKNPPETLLKMIEGTNQKTEQNINQINEVTTYNEASILFQSSLTKSDYVSLFPYLGPWKNLRRCFLTINQKRSSFFLINPIRLLFLMSFFISYIKKLPITKKYSKIVKKTLPAKILNNDTSSVK